VRRSSAPSHFHQKSVAAKPALADSFVMIVDDNQNDAAPETAEASDTTIKAKDIVYCAICTFPPEVAPRPGTRADNAVLRVQRITNEMQNMAQRRTP
jgi:hypothetical protein